MMGMDFFSFFILLMISIVVSAILHYGLNYYVTPGLSSFASKIVIGWVGAWLGTQWLGHWWHGLNYGEVYFVPAILGCLGFLVFAVDMVRTFGSVSKAQA